MAKDKQNSNNDIISKEKEIEAKLKKEQELKKAERDKKRKAKEKRAKIEQKKEIKRVKKLINLPYKALISFSIISTMLAFMITFYILKLGTIETLLVSFFVFALFYFGIGGIIAIFVYLLSIDKEKELNEQIRAEEEQKIIEDKRRQDEELAELEALEHEIARNRSVSKEKSKELIENRSQRLEQLDMSSNNFDMGMMGGNQFDTGMPSINDDLLGKLPEDPDTFSSEKFDPALYEDLMKQERQ